MSDQIEGGGGEGDADRDAVDADPINANENPDEESEACPTDGYRVEIVSNQYSKPQLALNVYLRLGGQRQWTYTVGSWINPSLADRGACRRLYHLWLGICHFMNSGGDLQADLLDLLWAIIDKHDPDLLRLDPVPEGGYLLHTGPLEDDPERFEHVFVDADDNAVIWVEDLDIRHTTLEELSEEYGEPEDEDQILGIDADEEEDEL